MSNAGSLLAGALHRNINLILHGHEHRKAQSRLRSTLSGSAQNELQIVSLGAPLATDTPDGKNWYSVIDIEQSGTIKMLSFPSYQQEFETEGKLVILRSQEEAFNDKFAAWKQSVGYTYNRVTSVTILDKDGDARRVVECNGLHILDAVTARAQNHEVTMAYTSGYIDIPEVHQGVSCNLAGIHFAENPPERTERHKILKRTIRWSNRTLQVNEKVDYRYTWFAVNGFAMNDLQFQCKYSDGSGMEFTHFVVEDPM